MRWEITTQAKIHIVSALGSSEAIAKVKKVDVSDITSARILPRNTLDKIKSVWHAWSKKL